MKTEEKKPWDFPAPIEKFEQGNIWQQPAQAPVPADPVEPLSLEEGELVADQTLELLSSQGYCLWKCRQLRGDVIMIVDQVIPLGAPAGYPVYTLAEVEKIDPLRISTLRLVYIAKVRGKAIVTSVWRKQ